LLEKKPSREGKGWDPTGFDTTRQEATSNLNRGTAEGNQDWKEKKKKALNESPRGNDLVQGLGGGANLQNLDRKALSTKKAYLLRDT